MSTPIQVNDKVKYFRRANGSWGTRSATLLIGTVVKVTPSSYLIELKNGELVRAMKENVELVR